jgi:hypothetical protein
LLELIDYYFENTMIIYNKIKHKNVLFYKMTTYHGGKQRIGKELSKIIYDVSIDIEKIYEFDIKGSQ